MILRKAQLGDLPMLKDMCVQCFDEAAEDVEFLFSAYLSEKIAYVAEASGVLAASLYLVPCKMATQNGERQGHYLYGAATMPGYRKQGVMHKLIAFALEGARACGHSFSVLLPASAPLYQFYGAQGYKRVYCAKHAEYTRKELEREIGDKALPKECLFDNIDQLRFNICKDFYGTILWDKNVLSFARQGALFSKGDFLCCENGYLLFIRSGREEVFVSEFMCKPEHEQDLLCLLYHKVNAQKYKLRQPPWLAANNNRAEDFGMIFPLSKEIDIQKFYKPYLGLTFD